jgi:hypothetical protein
VPPAVDTGSLEVGARRHTLLVAEDDQQRRTSAAAWVERALAVGEKVYYKGWQDPDEAPEKHWLAGPDGPRAAPEAFRTGQLELANYAVVLTAAGWTNEGVRKYHTEELERAFDEGWSSVAMAHETVKRAMADENEAAEVAEHEAGYDVLMSHWPLRVLCQLTVAEENEIATWETVAMHHRDLVDGPWSAGVAGGLWQPRGAIDAYVARRFGAAAVGAMRLAAHYGPDPDLHADLSAIEFIDVAAVQMLLFAARSAPVGQRVVLHHAPRMVQRLVEAVGRPETVVYGSGR